MSAAATRAPTEGHRSMEERLRQMESLAALNTLIAGIAHNLSNPLTSIGTFLEMLPAKWETSEVFRTRNYALAMADLQRVREQVVSLTKAAVSPEIASDSPWEIKPLIAELQLHALGVAGDRGIRVVVQGGEIELRGPAPREVLKQILTVLLDNAIAFAPSGGEVVFSVDCRTEKGADLLCFDIRDDGPGVPLADTERVFEPFYTTREGGMGIGLFVGRQLARAYGGSLDVRTEGRGGWFQLAFPGSTAAADL